MHHRADQAEDVLGVHPDQWMSETITPGGIQRAQDVPCAPGTRRSPGVIATVVQDLGDLAEAPHQAGLRDQHSVGMCR